MAYRKTIGVSLITSSMVLAIAFTFVVFTQKFAATNYVTYLIFLVLLLLIAMFILLSNFFTAHVSSVKFMREEEHKEHSKRMGLWMITIVLGVTAFLMPLFFVAPYVEPVALLITLGGVFLLLYVSIFLLFRQYYNELIIGTVGFWFMLIFGFVELNNIQFNVLTKSYFSAYLSIMSIMIISSFVGLAMLPKFNKGVK